KKDLEDDLKCLGLPYGNSSRNEKFSIIEKRMYPVTEDFPRIVPESFKNDVIPNGITHIVYNVDLGAVKNYTSW
ncbi:PD-(D/E)XK motif protein, partial [uncultured Treponema sp.]|uniref:PD-(D/E)XK motif protein n=1 Tax=uncultured Treponema sp. TaxID=162155 RepID=UPI0025F69D73